MTAAQQNAVHWVLKQTPLTVILLAGMFFMQDYFKKQLDKQEAYFTTEITKRDTKIQGLEAKVDRLVEQILIFKLNENKNEQKN